MADSTVETFSMSDNGHAGAAAIKELAGERNVWPLERYAREAGTDWLRLWQAWVVVALAFAEVLLAFRLGFKLAAANPVNGFVDMVYGLSAPLAAPFEGIIASSKLGANGSFEPSILVGMLAYMVAAVLLITLAWAVTTTEQARAHAGLAPRVRAP